MEFPTSLSEMNFALFRHHLSGFRLVLLTTVSWSLCPSRSLCHPSPSPLLSPSAGLLLLTALQLPVVSTSVPSIFLLLHSRVVLHSVGRGDASSIVPSVRDLRCACFPPLPPFSSLCVAREQKLGESESHFNLKALKGASGANLYFRGNRVIITALAFPRCLFSAGTTTFLFKGECLLVEWVGRGHVCWTGG